MDPQIETALAAILSRSPEAYSLLVQEFVRHESIIAIWLLLISACGVIVLRDSWRLRARALSDLRDLNGGLFFVAWIIVSAIAVVVVIPSTIGFVDIVASLSAPNLSTIRHLLGK